MRVTCVMRLLLVPLLLISAGCASVISQGVRDQVEPGIAFKDVFQDPETYKGKVVLWAGVIVQALNRREGTLIEVLQKPADAFDRPQEVDESEGRFLALYDGFLDVAIYAEGKEVTVAGEVRGRREKRLGEIDYTYPLLAVRELHLWPARTREPLLYLYPYLDPYDRWHHPRWWRHDPYRVPW